MKKRDLVQEEALEAVKGKRKAGLGISVGVGKNILMICMHPACLKNT
jgi:hypothetical protein